LGLLAEAAEVRHGGYIFFLLIQAHAVDPDSEGIIRDMALRASLRFVQILADTGRV